MTIGTTSSKTSTARPLHAEWTSRHFLPEHRIGRPSTVGVFPPVHVNGGHWNDFPKNFREHQGADDIGRGCFSYQRSRKITLGTTSSKLICTSMIGRPSTPGALLTCAVYDDPGNSFIKHFRHKDGTFIDQVCFSNQWRGALRMARRLYSAPRALRAAYGHNSIATTFLPKGRHFDQSIDDHWNDSSTRLRSPRIGRPLYPSHQWRGA